MHYLREDDPQWPTALEALRDGYDNKELTQLSRAFVGKKPPTRKDDLVAGLLRLLESDQLPELWNKLTPLEQSAAAETAWSREGRFHADAFHAKYGKWLNPQSREDNVTFGFGSYSREQQAHTLLDLIEPGGVMPRDIQGRLREFVPKPAEAKVKTVEALPDHIDSPTYTWNEQTRKSDRGSKAIPIQRREMERSAANDLFAVLRLAGAGKLSVTEKQQWPTPPSMRAVAGVLDGDDFYAIPARKAGSGKASKRDDPGIDDEETAGPIRAFAWPMILQAGALAKAQGTKLLLTKSGKEALAQPPHVTLRMLWERWMDNGEFDEFRRIDVIRGQTGNAKRWLTPPDERREAISAALAECPVGQWITLTDFSSFMQAAGHAFEVTSNAYSLYLFDPQYGSLNDDWNMLQLRYILCLVMEYAATLGLVDIAYVPPAGARSDYGGLWGTDDLAFLSRYDGLLYMRINALGRWCMGLSEDYAPPPLEVRNILEIRPEREVIAIGPLTPADRMLLDTFGESSGRDSWLLDGLKILTAASEGRKIAELAEFLESASGDGLPNPTASFLQDLEQRLSMFRDEGAARLLHCESSDLATALTTDPISAKTCYRLDERLLAVPQRSEAAFRRALEKYGYVLSPGLLSVEKGKRS